MPHSRYACAIVDIYTVPGVVVQDLHGQHDGYSNEMIGEFDAPHHNKDEHITCETQADEQRSFAGARE
jgi:hypothetical protein